MIMNKIKPILIINNQEVLIYVDDFVIFILYEFTMGFRNK